MCVPYQRAKQNERPLYAEGYVLHTGAGEGQWTSLCHGFDEQQKKTKVCANPVQAEYSVRGTVELMTKLYWVFEPNELPPNQSVH